MALKERLAAQGSVFTSETDAEVIAHLIAELYAATSPRPCARAYAQLEGHYAFVAISLDEPDLLVGARKECPLIVGRGEGEQFVASAVPAFLAQTRRCSTSRTARSSCCDPDGVQIMTAAGERRRARASRPSTGIEETAEKGGYETFMLKEIHEQADAVAETIADRTARGDGVDLDEPGALDEALLRGVQRIVIVACGTAYHAGLIGRYAIEEWARLPVEIDIASEYRYRNPVVGPGDLVIGISQSGETADTLAAMRLARERGRDGARDHQHDGLAGHARGRRRPLHARRPRDRRRRDQDVRLPGRRHVPARRCASPSCAARSRRRAWRSWWASSSACRTASTRCSSGCRSAARRRSPRACWQTRVLPVHRPPRRPAGRARGRAEAEGDLLHRDRRVRGRRDEARADRAARRVHAGRLRRHATRRCSRSSSRTCRRCARAARA